MSKQEEVLIAIPKSEYDFLLSCKRKLIELHEAEIQQCHNEMQGRNIQSIINNAIKP